MQLKDANAVEAGSSAASTTLDAAPEAPLQDTGALGADSSAATGANTDTNDTLSVVRDVVDSRASEASPDSPTGQVANDGADPLGATDPQQPSEPDNENYTDVPFHKHPRFQHLVKQAREYKTDAVRYQNIQTYLDNNGISSEEAADGFIIMGLMKTNPRAAWEKLKPTVAKLLVAAGEVPPDDLQQRVTRGELSEEAALEMSRSRAAVQSMQFQQSFSEKQRERQQQQSAAQAAMGAAVAWESERRARDPNFEAKLPLIQKEVVYLQHTEGVPTTADGVRQQLAKAYSAVVLPVAPIPPKPKVAPRPVGGGQVSGNAQPTPQNTLDIIRAEVAGRANA